MSLVDAESAASSALRQANDDLGIAYRDLCATRGQLVQTSSVAVVAEPRAAADDADRPTDFD